MGARGRSLRAGAGVAAVMVVVLSGAAPASPLAEAPTVVAGGGGADVRVGVGVPTGPPQELTDPVTDLADALTQAERAEVRDAFATLEAEHGIDLHVVLIDGFDGMDGPSWTERTFDRSGLGADDALLAVAVSERRYGYVEETDVTAERATQVAVEEVEPHLREGDWTGAAVAMAQGYAQPDTAGSRWGARVLGILVSAGAAVAGVLGLRTRRDRRSRAEHLLAQREELSPRLGPARERVERLAEEEGYVAAQLSEQDVAWLREERERAEGLLDKAVRRLEPVPREIGWWPPRESSLRSWMSGVDGTRSTLDDLDEHLEVVETELTQTRAVVADPSVLEGFRRELAALRERHRHATEAGAPDAGAFVRRRHGQRLAEAQAALTTAAEVERTVPELVEQRQGRLAHEALTAARGQLATAEQALDHAADPQAELEQAQADLASARSRLELDLRQARHHLEQHGSYARQAGRVGRRQVWDELSPDALAGAVRAAEAALTPPAPEDPEPVLQLVKEADDRLASAVRPYDDIRSALDRERQRVRAAAARAAAEREDDDGGSGGSRRRSSGGRSRSRSSSRSRSRSSSRRSSGGGRF